jgi:hypothetical protein
VTVTASPGQATAVTDASGEFSLPGLDIGAYVLAFHLTGYIDQTVTVVVSPSGPTKVAVALAADPDAGAPPTVTVSDQLAVGFGQPVTITATVQGTGPFTFAWTQETGAPVALAGADSAALSFTTQDFATAMGPLTASNARFGALGVNQDQAGNFMFHATVTDALGRSTQVMAHVDATRPTSGLRMVPVGVPFWVQGDGPVVSPMQTTWSWALDLTGASGSQAALVDPAAQFTRFTPDVVGTYVVKEGVAAKTLTVYAGTWLGEMTTASQSTCTLCHTGVIAPDLFTPWEANQHSSVLQKVLDGVYGPDWSEHDLCFLTTGYDKTAKNGGFADVQASVGWKFPDQLQPGNYSALLATPKLGQLAGIGCENCHGPQVADTHGPHANVTNPDVTARISWSASVCGHCHQHAPFDGMVADWVQGKHSDLGLAYVEATVEARGLAAAHCGRCHSAQGFGQYVSQLNQGYAGLLTSDGQPAAPGNPSPNAATIGSLTALGLTQAAVEPVSCQACHDPHDETNPAQLRIYDALAALPNGLTSVSGAGEGMICMTCHNTRNGEHSDFVAAPASYAAPHAAAQADVMYGFNAYFVPRYTPSKHLGVADTCVGCHSAAAEQVANTGSNHSFKVDSTLCAACHSSNVDGVALQASYQAQLDAAGKAIDAKVLNLIAAALLSQNGGAYTARVWDPTSDAYSSTAASNVVLAVAPASIDNVEIHGQMGFILHLPAAITVALVDSKGNPAGSIDTADVYVPAGSLANANATAPLFAASSDHAKALWNWYLLSGDKTLGVHNPGFYDAVLTATNVKVAALP